MPDWLPTVLGLVYLMIGLVLAAFVYEAFNGTLDMGCGECEDCRGDADLVETLETLDMLQQLRGFHRGRVAVAVLTAVLCLISVLAWPGLLLFTAVSAARRKRS